ncbi:hypothetical protein A3Q56_05930, partial [Intoshia linei]
DIGSDSDKVDIIKTKVFSGVYSGSQTKIYLHELHVQRGMNWKIVCGVCKESISDLDGFYILKSDINTKKIIIYAKFVDKNISNDSKCIIYRPNTGKCNKKMKLDAMKRNYVKIDNEKAKTYWEWFYEASSIQCIHKFRKGACRQLKMGMKCENGMRFRTYNVLSGSVLSVWKTIEKSLFRMNYDAKIQIVRLVTTSDKRVVGCLIPNSVLNVLETMLEEESKSTKILALQREIKSEEKTQIVPKSSRDEESPLKINKNKKKFMRSSSEASDCESDENSESDDDSDILSISSMNDE